MMSYDVSDTVHGITTIWDRYDNMKLIGDEYITSGDGLIQDEVDKLENEISSDNKPLIKPIYPCMANEYNQTLYDFLVVATA